MATIAFVKQKSGQFWPEHGANLRRGDVFYLVEGASPGPLCEALEDARAFDGPPFWEVPSYRQIEEGDQICGGSV